jgi:hypothetical protein
LNVSGVAAGAGSGGNTVVYSIAASKNITTIAAGGVVSTGGIFYNPNGSLAVGIGGPPALNTRLDVQGGSVRFGPASASSSPGDLAIARAASPSTGYMYFGTGGANFGYQGSLFQTSAGLTVGSGNLTTTTGLIAAAQYVQGTAFYSGGTAPSLANAGGCVGSGWSGGSTAGQFTAVLCTTSTYKLSGFPTSPHGYTCVAHDQTTPADTLVQTANTNNSCTLSGSTAAGDTIVVSSEGW